MPDPSTACDITSFSITVGSTTYTGSISGLNITVRVPVGTTVTALTPTIAVSTGATVSPTSGTAKNFSNPVTYTVTAEDTTTTKTYVVSVVADLGNASVTYKPRITGWAGVRVVTGDIDAYSEGGVDIGIDFVPRFAISASIDGPYIGFYDVATRKLKVYDSSGEVSSVPADTKYVVVLMRM